jgi:hypothetical protein
MPESHDIDPWFIPDGETLLGEPRGEHEQEHFEKTGELLSDDPEVCPHCGEPYEKETDGWFVHSWVPVDGDGFGDFEKRTHADGSVSWSRGATVKMGLVCMPCGKKRNVNDPFFDDLKP